MKLHKAVRAQILLLAGLVLLAGCSAAVTTSEVAVPAVGPRIQAGLKATMPPVSDKRTWSQATPGTPDPNVHIFAPAITSHLRAGLTKSGLFAALPAPDSPGAAALPDRVDITLNQFSLTKLGSNPWAAGAYIVDGLVQPVTGVVLVATQGQVDTGAYLLPSTRVGTAINADVSYSVPGLAKPVLQLSYQVQVELGAVSERQIRASLSETDGVGVKLGQSEGVKALDKLVQAISRDPNWLYLNTYIRLAQARQIIEAPASTPEQRMGAARGLVGLLQPLAYTPSEAKVLRDGVLGASARATMANDLRARYLGLSDAAALPPAQRVSEASAMKLFNDPAVERSATQGEVYNLAMSLIMKAMTPRQPKAAAAKGAPGQAGAAESALPTRDGSGAPGKVGPGSGINTMSAGGSYNPAPGAVQASADAAPKVKLGPPEKFSPQALRLQKQLSSELAAALQGKVRLQAVFLTVADSSVGVAWPVAQGVLTQINSPQVKSYLVQRQAS